MKERFDAFLQKLKKPKGWFLAIVYIVTVLCVAAALTLVIIGAESGVLAILSYLSYALAAVTLGYSVYTIVIYAPYVKGNVITLIKKYEFSKRLLEHYGFRTVVFAAFSLLVNVAYVVFNGVLAVIGSSLWYGALAGYYILLTVMRSGIVLYHRNRKTDFFSGRKEIAENVDVQAVELGKYRTCGALLIVMPLCLSFAILEMVQSGSAFVRVGWTVYAVAAYTFYKITMAIINVVKAMKGDDFTIRALRSISLADAMVSILALQTTLLYTFSDGSGSAWANALTGGAVCALTVALGVYMLVYSRKKMKRINQQKDETYAGTKQ